MQFKWNRSTLIVTFWILFSIVDSLKKMGALIGNYDRLIFYHLPGYLIWIILTFPLSYIFDWSGKFLLWKRSLLLIMLGIIIGTLKVLISWALFFLSMWLFKEGGVAVGLFEYLSTVRLFYFMEAFIISWVILFVFFVIEIYSKYKEQNLLNAELETQLAKAHLQTLKMQLRPHFLFNANNVISMLIRKGENDKAVEMISGLSELLRMSLDRENNQLITLKEELNLIRKYLYIEAIRFEDRLLVEYDIPENTESAMVPNFVLQPIVENAFKHGISKTIGKAILRITAYKNQTTVSIKIFNTGPNFIDQQTPGNTKRIGISNTINRLRQLYKNNFKFDLINKDGGVTALLTIPFQPEGN